ncbi:hypothetical protein KFK14_11415 [Sphingobium phenoxybenzoativorans]|uniref:Uncharacterized protein n=1 Tax=Sphingobium phenoxybenzoativorans TaxID=1592790 RepID=A0A975KBE1_9SPHN|nr:hypothetical protein [Sphingobium phenoxybenzoativorans]QUT07937.1 hypothetical protein KFK14_11415 [Sphingobium phenoxybenzoativorans]
MASAAQDRLAAQPSTPRESLRRNLQAEVTDLTAKLGPPPQAHALGELTRCLVLTVPSGMNAEDRKAWLRVALAEVRDIPAYMFDEACAAARKVADHPAKIIPEICKYRHPFLSKGMLEGRLSAARAQLENLDAPRLASADPDIVDVGEVSALVSEMQGNLGRRTSAAKRDYANLRMPTDQELAELAKIPGEANAQE